MKFRRMLWYIIILLHFQCFNSNIFAASLPNKTIGIASPIVTGNYNVVNITINQVKVIRIDTKQVIYEGIPLADYKSVIQKYEASLKKNNENLKANINDLRREVTTLSKEKTYFQEQLKEAQENAKLCLKQQLRTLSDIPYKQELENAVAENNLDKIIRLGERNELMKPDLAVGFDQFKKQEAQGKLILARAYTTKGDFYKALKAYEEAYDKDPENVEIQTELAGSYHVNGHYDQALAHYQLILAKLDTNNPDYARLMMNIGIVYFNQKRYQEARGYYDLIKPVPP